LNVNGGNPLPPDDYTFVVAGYTSITDLVGNKLDGNSDGIGGDDFVHGFSIQAPIATPTESPTPMPPTPTETPVPPTATATMTASPVPPSPAPTAAFAEMVYDDTDSSFLYSSGWKDEWKRAAYGVLSSRQPRMVPTLRSISLGNRSVFSIRLAKNIERWTCMLMIYWLDPSRREVGGRPSNNVGTILVSLLPARIHSNWSLSPLTKETVPEAPSMPVIVR